MSKARNAPVAMSAGDTLSLVFSITTAQGTPNYASPVASFNLINQPVCISGAASLLLKSGAMANNNGAWTSTVTLNKSDTISIPQGVYYYQLEIVDGNLSQIVADGVLQITANIIG